MSDIYFTWSYRDNATGDEWGGDGYEDSLWVDYTAGSWWSTGSGYYYIASVEYGDYGADDGNVFVNWGIDAATGESFYGADIDAGTVYGLGSEEGYVYYANGGSDEFGGFLSRYGLDTIGEAGREGGQSDTYYVWSYRDYATGDQWGGYGFENSAILDYHAGYQWDTGSGLYVITTVEHGEYTFEPGDVAVTWAIDQATGETFTGSDISGGTLFGLGSEEGHVYYANGTSDWFAGLSTPGGLDTIGEAGRGGESDIHFVWSYQDFATGDQWGGEGYESSIDVDYHTGWSLNTGSGLYYIAYAESGDFLPEPGDVTVTWGIDAATGQSFYGSGIDAGTTWGLGYEQGLVYYADGTTDWFGGFRSDYLLDTIGESGSANEDVAYGFVFWDDSGDWYGGWGIADAWQGYQADQWLDSGYGYYQITNTVEYGADYGWEDAVMVTSYYDAGTGAWGWADGWGGAGLSSEYGDVYADEAMTDWLGSFAYGGQIDADFV